MKEYHDRLYRIIKKCAETEGGFRKHGMNL